MSKGGTRERIILAAARLIHQQGYRATTIDDILAASGVKKGNLYYYFSSKEALGLAVLDRLHEGHLASVRGHLENRDKSARERISQWLLSMVGKVADAQCAHGCPFGNLALEVSDTCEVFRNRIAAHFAAWQEIIAETVRQGKAAGEFGPDLDPDEFAASAIALLEGAILMAKLTREIRPLERAIADLRGRLEASAPQPA